ncbi:N2,N2-dimethylguanosine tRNA methyltransferase [Aphanomyces invadans]|uniref:tRNA (guanine(26)-N(2))-dimethyltransferase n=1 Tax=Aphanomyces invadans TaxID=157072 RepID=A0A024U463_9STRA|nr:N2,N2-dimethylguanosine tRNA methyltransferase [Aphanomyces invadans]ETW01211.1 N2,N2-dimethylguanosine tRNA methyltransferase [Aphanomyces invadans]|eukprot:XP_008870209.1 N2,N2-dimethylguanosine tRNA methyltransferase [Aphanomyces invadans]
MLLRRASSRSVCRLRPSRTIMTTPADAKFDGEIISEGRAKILFPKGNQVFYNKVQVLNRDLSIAVINQFAHERAKEAILKQRKREKNEDVPTEDEVQAYVRENADTKGLKIFEALAASGLRSIRYLQEIEGVKSILVNDLDPAAVISIKRNIEYNHLSTDKLIPNEDDATAVMYSHRKEADNFDVIDLDPYGSASIFLDGAVQAIANGGLLCVTCTDMPVLCGKDPDVCFSRYGVVPYKSNYLHENALRMVLHAIESAAVKYQKHIVPIISCSIDFYVRVFVRVYKSPVNVKASMTKQSYVYQCTGCDSFHLQPLGKFNGKTYHASFVDADVVGSGKCDQCGRRFKMSGPIWSAPLHNKDLVLKIREHVLKNAAKYPTKDRLHGLLTSVSEEVVDAPLYYTLPGLSKTLHCQQPRMDQVQVALMNAGYKVSQSHKVPEAIKTTAPNHVVWDIMRSWVKKHPIHKKRENDDHDIGMNILAKEPAFDAQFSGKRPSAEKEKALRFPKNPEANWGPKSRARGLAPNELVNVVEDEQEPEGKKPKLDE